LAGPFAALRGEPASACLVKAAVVWCSHAGGPFEPDLSRMVGSTPTGAGFAAFTPDPVVAGAGVATVGSLVWDTSDGGKTWREAGARGDFTRVAITRDGTYLAGADGVLWRRRGSAAWVRLPGPAGPTTLAADPVAGVVYAASGGAVWRASKGRPFRLRVRGLPRSARIAGVGARGRTVIVVMRARPFVSTDAGRTYRRLPAASVVVPDPHDSRRLVAVTAHGLDVSVDAGRTWKAGTKQRPFVVVPDPSRPGRWYTLLGGVVRTSADGGLTWRAVTRQPRRLAFGLDGALAVSPGRLWWFAPSFSGLYWRATGR
jgi:hypothetical protein